MQNYRKTQKTVKKPQKATAKPAENSDDFISPMDFWDMDVDQPLDEPAAETQLEQPQSASKKRQQGLFVLGTDSGVGKTVAICALGTLLKEKSIDAAAMKPIGCSEEGARVFIDAFEMEEEVSLMTPYSYTEKISPYFAFRRHKIVFDIKKVVESYKTVSAGHDLTLVEGTGGLLDPLMDQLTLADLIKELGLGVIIVAPLRRGTLSQLMMIADQAKRRGLVIRGVLFTENEKAKPEAFFNAKIQAVRELIHIPVIGIIPFLEKGSPEEIKEKCQQKVSFNTLLNLQKPSPRDSKRRRRPRSRRRPAKDVQSSSAQQEVQEETNASGQSA